MDDCKKHVERVRTINRDGEDAVDAAPAEKPGWQTTEFWVTLVTSLLTGLTVIGIVNADDAKTLAAAITNSVAAATMLVANAMVLWKYIQARVSAKSEQAQVKLQYLQMRQTMAMRRYELMASHPQTCTAKVEGDPSE